MSIEAFIITPSSMTTLENKFPPVNTACGHHITHKVNAKNSRELPSYVEGETYTFTVTGYVYVEGFEVIVLSLDGTDTRPDGNLYHITWSMHPRAVPSPSHSNAILAHHGFHAVAYPFDIEAVYTTNLKRSNS